MYHQANNKILAPFTSGTFGTFKRRLKALDSSIARLSTNKVSRQRHPHRGFTLVELLVVIVIIAMLAALVTPAIMIAMSRAKVARIKAEIDMLHMAIMNYKSEYGSFPPSSSGVTANTDPAVKHVARLFPRCSPVINEFNAANAQSFTPQNALAAWLTGYSTDPTKPLTGGTKKKLYDFDQSRLSGLNYAPSGKPGSPYIYIDSSVYTVPIIPPFMSVPTFALTGGTYFAHRVPTSSAPLVLNDLNQPAFNPDTFQILCAGQDEEFGTDDDLSNFWPGTKRDYLDSL